MTAIALKFATSTRTRLLYSLTNPGITIWEGLYTAIATGYYVHWVFAGNRFVVVLSIAWKVFAGNQRYSEGKKDEL